MTDEPLCEINVKSPLIQSSHSLPLTIRRNLIYKYQVSVHQKHYTPCRARPWK